MTSQAVSTARREPIPVVIAARHPSVRAGLWQLLDASAAAPPIAVASTFAALLRLLPRMSACIVVVDELVVGDGNLERLSEIAAAAPAASVVVVGMNDHPGFVTRAVDAGAVDYVRLDDAERLVRAVAAAGGRSRPSVVARQRAAPSRP